MGGKRSRRKGHDFERKAARQLKLLFPEAICARAGDLSQDAKGKDILNTGRFAFQCKSVSNTPSYYRLIPQMADELPGQIPVVLHQRTERAGSRFMNRGEYAILRMDDFLDLLCQTMDAPESNSTEDQSSTGKVRASLKLNGT